MDRRSLAWWAVAIAVLALPALLLGACVVWEPPPITYHNVPFPVLSDAVVAGRTVPLAVDRCVPGDAPITYTFTRTLRALGEVGGPPPGEPRAITLPSGGSQAAPGCELVESRVNQLPSDIEPGTYQLEAITVVQGRFKMHFMPWSSAPFTVVARDGQ